MQKSLWNIFLLVGILFSTILFADEIVWQKDISAAFEKAKKEHKLVMVFVEGESCRWCKKMKHRTLSDESVDKRLQDYVAVKVFRENKENITDLPEIQGVPSIFFMTAQKKILESVIGYYNVEDFISYLNDVEKKVKSPTPAL
jgi:thioredoxin-related protein